MPKFLIFFVRVVCVFFLSPLVLFPVNLAHASSSLCSIDIEGKTVYRVGSRRNVFSGRMEATSFDQLKNAMESAGYEGGTLTWDGSSNNPRKYHVTVEQEDGTVIRYLSTSPSGAYFDWSQDTICPAGYSRVGNRCHYRSNVPGVCPLEPEQEAGEPEVCVGNPCSPTSGNKYQVEVDYKSVDDILTVQRAYNSRHASSRKDFGKGWTGKAVPKAAVTYAEVSVYLPSGSEILFKRRNAVTVVGKLYRVPTPDGGQRYGYGFIQQINQNQPSVWDEQRPKGNKLVAIEGGYQLTLSNDEKILFNDVGQVQTYTYRNGQVVSYQHAGNTVHITAPSNRSITIQYENELIKQITDSAGGVIQYNYDEVENLVSVVYQDGSERLYHYESPYDASLLTGITDENGNRFATWAYNHEKKAVLSKHGEAIEVNNLDFSRTNRTTVVDDNGAHWEYYFTEIAGKKRITSTSKRACESCTKSWSTKSYFTEGDLAGLAFNSVDFDGTMTQYEYNDRRLQTKRTVASGTPAEQIIETVWHEEFALPVSISSPGKLEEFQYNANGQVIVKTTTDTATNEMRSWHYDYYTSTPEFDAQGNQVNAALKLKLIDGPRNDVQDITSFEYYSNGDLKAMVNALGHRTEILEYDAHGNVAKIADENGVLTQLTFNAKNQLIQTNRAGAITSLEYHPNGLVKRATTPNDEYLEYSYDIGKRLVAIENQNGERIEYDRTTLYSTGYVPLRQGKQIFEQVYSSTGQITRQSTKIFDTFGQLSQVLGANQQEIVTTYNNVDRRISQLEDNRLNTTWAYDALKRVTSTIDPEGGNTRYGYDQYGNLSSVTDPENMTTTYTYNAFGELLNLSSPDSGVTQYAYDEASNLIEKIDANGVVTQYQYDALNRMTATIYEDATFNVQYIYDLDNHEYSIGRLSQVVDQIGVTQFNYTEQGQLAEKTQYIAGEMISIYYEYDQGGRLTSISYPSGSSLLYIYGVDGNVSSVERHQNGQVEILASNFDYIPFGSASYFQYGNGLSNAMAYDLDYRITSMDISSIMTKQLGYNTDNSIRNISDAQIPSINQSFEYDNLNRLVQAVGAYGDISFDYDLIGNRSLLSNSHGVENYEYATTGHQLLSINQTMQFEYDSAGNTVRKGNTVFGYNPMNRMAHVEGSAGLLAEYQYNANGERQVKHTTAASPQGESSQFYIYDQSGNLIAELDSQGNAKREYYYANGQRLAMRDFSNQSPLLLSDDFESHHEIDHKKSPIENWNGHWYWEVHQGEMGNHSLTNFYDSVVGGSKPNMYTGGNTWQNTSVAFDFTWSGDKDVIYPFTVSLRDQGASLPRYRLYTMRIDDEFWFYVVRDNHGLVRNQDGIPDNCYSWNANYIQDNRCHPSQPTQNTAPINGYPVVVTPEQVNTVRFDVNGFDISLYVNGQQIGSTITDYHQIATQGRVGFKTAGGTVDSQTGEITPSILIDNIEITDPSKTASQTYYLHNDHLGTTQAITDQVQDIVWQTQQSPFGSVEILKEDITFNLRFPGQYYDAESGLYYNYFRYYDPELGRYVTSDPIGLNGGISTYGYVSAQPLSFFDFFGLASLKVNTSDGDGGFTSGHVWAEFTFDNGESKTIGNFPNSDDSVKNPYFSGGPQYGSYGGRLDASQTWVLPDNTLRSAYNSFDRDGYNVYTDNCTDRIEETLDKLGIKRPSFNNILGVSDPKNVTQWINRMQGSKLKTSKLPLHIPSHRGRYFGESR